MKLILDNGKEITLSQELTDMINEEIKQSLTENKRLRNFAKEGDKEHFFVDFYGEICRAFFISKNEEETFNAFTSKEFAEKIAFKQLMERKLLKFKDEFDNEILNWNNNDEVKYRLFYNETDKEIETNFNYGYKQQGSIHFSSKEIAEKCIEMYKDDLIKYFEMDIW